MGWLLEFVFAVLSELLLLMAYSFYLEMGDTDSAFEVPVPLASIFYKFKKMGYIYKLLKIVLDMIYELFINRELMKLIKF